MKVKLCIDPGHGMSNRKKGLYDPGAEGGGLSEADIALQFALTLKTVCIQEGIPYFLTRDDDRDPDPVGTRDDRGEAAACTHFLAIHCNSADATSASGTETFYRDARDMGWAAVCQGAALAAFGSKSRGLKEEGASQHTRLAVFDFDGPCALVELEFISNAAARKKLTSRDVRLTFAEALIRGLKAFCLTSTK